MDMIKNSIEKKLDQLAELTEELTESELSQSSSKSQLTIEIGSFESTTQL